jgi:hypothetical protein
MVALVRHRSLQAPPTDVAPAIAYFLRAWSCYAPCLTQKQREREIERVWDMMCYGDGGVTYMDGDAWDFHHPTSDLDRPYVETAHANDV